MAVTPDEMHEISFFSNGYHGLSRRVQLATGEEREVAVQLQPVLSGVQIIAEPADAQLYVDGEHRGPANQTIRLRAASQRIEVRRPGYVPYRADFTPRPGLEQVLRVRLQTEAEARRAALKPLITTAAGQELKLFDPGRFMMGSSRREAGRRPDEILLGEVRMARPFYLGLREVSNAQYRRFDPSHNSGIAGGATLNNEAQPAVQLSWEQAALYCNWLSGQESLRAFYIVEDGTVVGIDPAAGGYRLPTEAEWAWAARSVDAATSLRYPWGEAPPPPPSVSGNFADATVIRFIPAAMAAYDDGHFNTAPVASFPPNHRGLYDMAGNAAEWINDYYGGSVSRNREPDPLGPQQGLYRVIRGPSWKHSGTDLRLSARDSALSTETRDDLGFRIARYTEE